MPNAWDKNIGAAKNAAQAGKWEDAAAYIEDAISDISAAGQAYPYDLAWELAKVRAEAGKALAQSGEYGAALIQLKFARAAVDKVIDGKVPPDFLILAKAGRTAFDAAVSQVEERIVQIKADQQAAQQTEDDLAADQKKGNGTTKKGSTAPTSGFPWLLGLGAAVLVVRMATRKRSPAPKPETEKTEG